MSESDGSRLGPLTRGRLRKLLLVWAASCALLVLGAHLAFRIEPAEPLREEARRWALDALASADEPPPPPAAIDAEPGDGMVIVSAWRAGELQARHIADEGLHSSVMGARERFASLRAEEGEVHYTLTLVEGEGPLLRDMPILEALGLVPLRDGILVRLDGSLALRTPDDLLLAGAYDAGVETFVPDMSFGVNLEALLAELAEELGVSAEELDERGELRRFRSVTHAAHDYPREVPVDEASLVEASEEGARFILRHQGRTGRFTYLYDARAQRPRNVGGYNVPRHSGTTFFLAQVDRVIGMPEAREGALRALRWLASRRLTRCGAEDILCIRGYGTTADVGSAALTVVAATEVLEKSDDPLARQLVEGLTAFLRAQQREDGELMHLYDIRAQQPIDEQLMYYSGEAAYALLKAHRVLGDERNLEAARRLMAHLTGAGWDFLGSRYYYGEEHWTCIAAGEARDRIESDEGLDFCKRWYEWNDALQYREGQTPWSMSGAFGVGPILIPRLTPIGSRTEAFIGTYELFETRGVEQSGIRAVIERGLGALLRWRWSPGPVHLFGRPELAFGGVPGSPADLTSRNDFVQHAGSAWVRWVEVLRREAAAADRP